MEYKVLHHRMLTDLENAVNVAIKEGWKPLGGITVDEKEDQCLQAITREKEFLKVPGMSISL